MAGPNAAYASDVQVAPDSSGAPGTYADAGLQGKATIGLKGEQIDVTQLNVAGYRMRLPGLLDGSVKLSVWENFADTAQGTIRTAITTRVRVWVKGKLNDSTHNIVLACNITDFNVNLDPAKAVEVEVPMVLDGTPTNPVVIS